MPYRRRISVLTALFVAPVAAAGCVSDDQTTGSPSGFPWVVETEIPQSRSDLRNASGLDLSYARWQEQLGHLPEAEETYRRVLKNDAGSIDAQLGLARVEQLAGRTDAAEQAYLRVVQAMPRSPQALDALGQFYAAEQRWSEANASLAKAVELAPEDVICRHHYAVALARSGDLAQAFVQFKQAVGEAEAHYNVGYILHEQGRNEQAEREFLQAVTLRPELTAAQMMLDELRRDRNAPELLTRVPSTPLPQRSPSSVVQTAAVAAPERRQPVSTATAAVSKPSADAAPAGPPSPQWEMPKRRNPATIFAEQLRNQSPLSE